MNEEFPSNSRNRPLPPRMETNEPIKKEKKVDPVVSGKVIRRKKPLGRRLRDTFFNGESGVFGYLLKEVLVPALQATATDMVTQGIEKAVYGEVRTPRRNIRPGGMSRSHISYDRPSSIIRTSSNDVRPARRPSSHPSSINLDEIIVATHIEAEIIDEKMREILEEYPAVTVADLYGLLGQTATVTDYKFGWTDLSDFRIKRVREGYWLDLPDPDDLR